MSEHQWGDAKEDVRVCQRAGCGILFDPIPGLWKRTGALGWETIKRSQPIPPCRGKRVATAHCTHIDRAPVDLGPGHRVVGGFKVGQCERPALPGLVVCEYHATPEAMRMVILAMAAEIERLKGM